MDYPGGFITKTAPTLNPALGNAAPGVWRLNDVLKNIKAGTWPAIDPYFDYTTLLLHGNGTNGGQNNTFLDSSSNNFTITRNGNTTQGTFSPFSQTGWSNYFDGSGDYLQAGTSSNLALGSGDFTVEGWHFCTGYNGGGALYSTINTYSSSTGFLFYIYSDGSYTIDVNGTILKTTAVAALNTWVHYAVVRSGSTITIYANGTSVGTVSNSTNFTDQYAVIGRTGAGTASNYYLGYLSNCRTVKGTAVYTSAFTPPTAPLTAITNTQFLTCQSNRFIDNSANQFTITRNGDTSVQAFSPFAPTAAYSASTVGGSGYFDGTGDYLDNRTVTNQFDVGSAFTLEIWGYVTSYPTDSAWFSVGGSTVNWNATTGLYISLYYFSNALYWQTSNGSGLATTLVSGTAPPLNSWCHVAIGYNGTTTRMWINGSSVGTSTASYNKPSGTDRFQIGAFTGASTPFFGYLSNVRFVKGTDVYGVSNTSITVPTSPPTNISNTSLLLNFTNAAIIDNTAKNVLETVANAQISTTQSKFGGASMAFDGTGDYLSAADSPNFYFGSGDWTIEAWLYINTAKNYNGYFGKRQTSLFGLTLQIDSGGTLSISASTTGSSWALAGASLGSGYSTGAWMHFAVTRSGTTITGWRNGTSTGTQTLS